MLYAAVIECDEIARTATRHRARLLDLACIVRGYAGLIIGRQKPFEAGKTPERVRRLGDALARARRVASGLPEKTPNSDLQIAARCGSPLRVQAEVAASSLCQARFDRGPA